MIPDSLYIIAQEDGFVNTFFEFLFRIMITGEMLQSRGCVCGLYSKFAVFSGYTDLFLFVRTADNRVGIRFERGETETAAGTAGFFPFRKIRKDLRILQKRT